MDQEFFGALRSIERERMHELWNLAKAGDLDDVAPEEQTLARIMLEHEAEYGMHFEFTNAVLDFDYRAAGEANPFLHVTFHAIVEQQLAARAPKEVFQFYNAMRRKKADHHDTLHMIAAILTPFLLRTIKQQQPFDEPGYCRQLRRLKQKRPEQIWGIIENTDEDGG